MYVIYENRLQIQPIGIIRRAGGGLACVGVLLGHTGRFGEEAYADVVFEVPDDVNRMPCDYDDVIRMPCDYDDVITTSCDQK